MTRQLAKPQPLHARFGDAFVILSVTLLSLASGAWLITSFGLELTSAMLASLAIYCILLLLHLLVRRSFADSPDEDEDDGALRRLALANRPGRRAVRGGTGAKLAHCTSARAGSGRRAALPPRSQPGIWPEPLPMPASA